MYEVESAKFETGNCARLFKHDTLNNEKMSLAGSCGGMCRTPSTFCAQMPSFFTIISKWLNKIFNLFFLISSLVFEM